LRGAGHRLAFVLALIVVASSAASGVRASDRVVSSAGLRADAEIVRDAFVALHPGLFRYRSAAAVDSAFDALDDTFHTDRSTGDAFIAFTRLTAAIRCGHTWPSFFNQRDSVAAAWFAVPRVPFHFRWVGDRMIVTRSFTGDSALRPGTEVVALDGVRSAAILQGLMPLVRTDGSNDAKRRAELEVSDAAKVEAFDVYHPLRFGCDSASVDLEALPPGAKQAVRIRVARMTAANRYARAHAGEPAVTDSSALWSFAWRDARTAVVRMPTWATYDSRWNWRAWLQDVFIEIAKLPGATLVIDLRGNEGGMEEIGDAVLAHLTAVPLRAAGFTRRVRFASVPDTLRPFLKTWDPSFYRLGETAKDAGDGWRELDGAGVDTIAPAAPRHEGRTYVLIGASNSSATFQFASRARAHRLCTLVGQPTGGNRRGINGGALFFLRLPNTGIEIDLPLIGYFAVTEEPDAGLMPDVRVSPTVAEIAAGRDPEMEAVDTHRRRGSRR